MTKSRRLLFSFGMALLGSVVFSSAYGECGGTTQCIGVGATQADAEAAHHGGTPTFTLAFGSRTTGTTSAAQTVFVAAVTGPAGTMAVLGASTIGGADAANFSITGGTCSSTNGPIHGGAPCTITVAFNPVTVGAKTATLTVPITPSAPGNITGRTVSLTGTGLAAPTAPTNAAATMSVPVNGSATLDLAPFITGAGVTGVAITTAPSRGTATVSGTSVTYTPARDYFGPDTFSYAATSGAGSAAPAVVSVSVSGRPDPARNAAVVGLLGAQAQTVQRFSRAQILNFQQRMESLHRGPAPTGIGRAGARSFAPHAPAHADAGAALRRFGAIPAARDSASDEATLAGAARVDSLPRGATGDPGGLRPSGAESAALQPLSFATTLISVASTRTLNLAGGSSAPSGLPQGTQMWMGGNISFGTRDRTDDSSGLRFSTDGISVGVDRPFGENLTLGMGLGYARDHTDIGTDGSQSRSRALSLTVYGSYQPSANTFIDGLIGYGVSEHDTDRFVAVANDFARAGRKGDQWFGSVAAGYEHRMENMLLSPYGRLDFAASRLKQVTESGAGANALTYFEQTQPALQFSLGLRAETRHQMRFGWALPRLRLEYRHDFEGDRAATLAYADQVGGTTYSIQPAGMNRNSLLIGVGSDFVLRDGLKLGVEYQGQRSFGPVSSQAIRFWLAKDLDGKGLPMLGESSRLSPNPVRVEAGYTWDDNLTRAQHATDKRSDHIYTLGASKSTTIPVGSHTRAVLAAFVNGDKLRTYTGLDRVSGGVNGEFQYRTSGAFDATTFGLFARVLLDQYDSEFRSGHRYSIGVNARQSLTDRIDVFGALAHNVRDASSDVFDARDFALRLNVDYALLRSGTLYLGGEYRRGDTVSTGAPSAENANIAKFLVVDDAFGGGLVAYRFDAKTWLWTLGYNQPLGPRDSIDFSWRRAMSTATRRPVPGAASGYGAVGAGGDSAATYTTNLLSITYLMRF